MRRLLPSLLLAFLLLAACGDDVRPPTTKADLARLAFDALKSGDVERLAPAVPTEADMDWVLATMTKEVSAEKGKELKDRFRKVGGSKALAKQADERLRASFAKARASAAEVWDWSQATFQGLVEEKSATQVDNGVESGDVFFLVRAGDREELFALGKCVRMPDRWVTMEGLRFRASPHSSLEDARLLQARQQLRMLSDMAKQFEIQNGRPPKSMADMGNPAGSNAPGVEKGTVQDPWGHPFDLQVVDGGVRVTSAGPDGALGTDDDLHWPEK